MVSLSITREQKIYAWKLVNQTNYGTRGKNDGTKEHQFEGILGEVCFADYYGLPRPVQKGGYDNGIDFVIAPHKVDLKTVGRTTNWKQYYTNNLYYEQVHNPYSQTTAYVFASINKTTNLFEIIGWQTKDFIINNCRMTDEGDLLRTRRDGTQMFSKWKQYQVDWKDLWEADIFLLDRIGRS